MMVKRPKISIVVAIVYITAVAREMDARLVILSEGVQR